MFIVTVEGDIYRFASGDWVKIAGALTTISVADALNVVGVDALGQAWQLTSQDTWQRVPLRKSVKRVSIGSAGVWFVGFDGSICKAAVN